LTPIAEGGTAVGVPIYLTKASKLPTLEAAASAPPVSRSDMGSTTAGSEARIAQMRRFNRFYTQTIGALGERMLQSPLSLSEVRVLYELAHAAVGVPPTARALVAGLGLDEGYLSRILRRFAQRGWLKRERAVEDRRRIHLSLTGKGRKAFAPLDARSHDQVAALLSRLAADDQAALLESMRTIERLLGAGGARSPRPKFTLRALVPGDIGWVVHRHGALYALEYGYDARFEALVAHIAADFVEHFDAKREACWIAERDGAIVGSLFLVRKSASVAKLRLLYVEPSARGLGVGARLVDECVRFARGAGYRRIVLWTQSELLAARRLYARAGFVRRASQSHRSFGRRLVAETWSLAL
jgi:DNA-binding MarR family transcriptional regulator/GNAT superfamily N-acetyltransferase